MNPWPDLRGILRGIPWAVVDGVATRAYMPERMTRDLDILVRLSDAERAIERLNAAGYVSVSGLALPGRALRSPEGVEVEVLFGDQPWLSPALEQAGLDPAGYPVLGLPYLVLMKLWSMRTQDLADVSRMLGLATDQLLDEVREVVSRYSPQDREDLESLIFLGKMELGGRPSE